LGILEGLMLGDASMNSKQSHLSQVLKQGLTALKQEDYTTAIALLEPLLQPESTLPPPDQIKAQMALLTAYLGSGDRAQAIAIGKILQQNPNPKIQAWLHSQLGNSNPPPSYRRSGGTSLANLAENRENPGDRPHPQHREDPGDRPHPQNRENPGDRAQRWNPLPRILDWPLRLAQVGTAIALLLIPIGLYWLVAVGNWFIAKLSIEILRWGGSVPDFSLPWLPWLVILAVLYATSPWILSAIWRSCYGMKPMTTAQLATYSPEAHRLLQRSSQQRNRPIPKLMLFPRPEPLIFSYGITARTNMIAVSQGLLDRLLDDELASLYAVEFAHLTNGSAATLSWVAVVLLLPFVVYDRGAGLGDRYLYLIGPLLSGDPLGKSGNRWIAFLQGIHRLLLPLPAYGLAAVATIGYGLFRALRWAGVGLAKQRTVYSDRTACNLTGNPNGLARALVKLAIGTAATVTQQQQTSPLLESLEPLLPISPHLAIPLGSYLQNFSPTEVLAWDASIADRSAWSLSYAGSHLGSRLQQLMQIAEDWKLPPEFSFDRSEPPAPLNSPQQRLAAWAIAPLTGFLLGWLLAILAWSIAWLGLWLQIYRLTWLGSDYGLFFGLPLLGLGLGTLLRFNDYFPDRTQQAAPQPSEELASSELAPAGVNRFTQIIQQSYPQPFPSSPLRLEGKLLGRSGLRNWLGTDLWLHTPVGLLKLQDCSPLGPLGNGLSGQPRPSDRIGATTTAIGWLRRGATPWLDLEQLRWSDPANPPVNHRANHQFFSLLLGTIAILLGILALI
jgi:Zn-dependent protease with chaperone function